MSPSDTQPPLYHALPQVDSPANVSRIELVDESVIDSDLPPVQAPVLVDSKVHWTYFILGCSVLLPWNVVITAMPFFLSRLATSPLHSTFASYLTTSFTAANFIFLAHATSISKNMTPSVTTHSSIVWLLVLNAVLTLTTFFTPSPGMFFAFILFNGAAQATVGAYLQTSVIAVASLFGPAAVQAMMSGQAAVAVAVSGVQVVSAAISVRGKPRTFAGDGSAEERSAFIFFALSTVFLAFSALAHSWLVKSPAYQQVAKHLESNTRTSGLISDHERRGLISRGPGTTTDSESRKNAIRIAKANGIYHVAVAYCFLATLAVFPPITTSIQPTNPDTHPLLFSAIHFLVFNVGDFLGRWVCSFPALLIWSAKHLLTLSLARTLFIPLFLMCNVQGGPSFSSSPPVINSDFLFMFLLFVFGWSNGYVSSLCMMSAPSVEHNPRLKGRTEDVDVAATVASFCLVGGLALGSIASFAVKATICRCNPFMT